MAKYVCKVCGYVHEGDDAPDECPVCRAKKAMFEKVEGELQLASEHKYGIYDLTVKNNPNISDEDKAYIFEQLKANFTGECSEVGMYLCMARIAHREGYPEIGLYWEKAAYEEAEHAAKFAELLGEIITDSTKKNLEMRVDAENQQETAEKRQSDKIARRKRGLTQQQIADDLNQILKGLLDCRGKTIVLEITLVGD